MKDGLTKRIQTDELGLRMYYEATLEILLISFALSSNHPAKMFHFVVLSFFSVSHNSLTKILKSIFHEVVPFHT